MHRKRRWYFVTNKDQSIRWVNARRSKDDFLLPVKAMAIVYKAKYLQALSRLVADQQVPVPPGINLAALIKAIYDKDWVVYAKKPFGGQDKASRHRVIQCFMRRLFIFFFTL
ncbi:MAG: transposase [Ferruginibacter sp.]|nr:transposase [Ferruginibacter sp.]